MRLIVTAFVLGINITDAACTWKAVNKPPSEWMSAAAASVGEHAVAFAGGTSINPITGRFGVERMQVTTYNPTTDAWHKLPNMSYARSAPAAAALNGRLFVFGGVQRKPNASHSDPDPTIKMSVVESIAISDNGRTTETHWKRETDLPGPRESPSAVAVGNRGIVIAGGFNSGVVNGVFEFEYFNSTFWFDGTTYKRLPDMPFKRSNMALVATDDIVYAFGGGEMDPSYASCARLDLKEGTNLKAAGWVPCATLINARSWAAAGIVGGGDEATIVLAGGMDGRFSPTNEVDMMVVGDGKNQSVVWTTDAECDLPVAAGFLSGATTGDGTSFIVAAGAARGNNAYLFVP